MSPTSSMEFIDTSLFENNSSSELSYKDPSQKLLIHTHFQKFFQDFPDFVPFIDKYYHFDGTSMNILKVRGCLHVSAYVPKVPLTIWIHENYPITSPMIFIESYDKYTIRKDHPFIDSGVVTPPYMRNWGHKRSNLCDLAHNLISLFQRDHPFMQVSSLKETMIDDLVARICEDLGNLSVQNQHEIEKWSNNQAKLQEKGDALDGFIYICSLKGEFNSLKEGVVELKKHNDKLFKWVRNNKNRSSKANDKLIEIVPHDSKMADCMAKDNAIDDAMYSLDKALENGVIKLGEYMKQGRVLAREQFYEKAMLLRLENSRSS